MILGEWARRAWYLLNRRRMERELEREMAAHREMMGDPRAFGNAVKLREEARDAWGWTWLDHACQDVRQASRVLRRAPGFTAMAALILSAGIGLNLAFFHLLNVAVLRPPAVKDPHTLVGFYRRSPTSTSNAVPYPAADFIRRHNTVLSAVLVRIRTSVYWDDNPEDRLDAAFVSANWFTELGYGAALGRVFAEPRDDAADAPPMVVVSHRFWRSRLQGDAGVVGRRVRINGRPVTVIGVAPATFPGLKLEDMQVWLPLHQADYFVPGVVVRDSWGSHNTQFYGRLRPGVSPPAAAEGLRPILQELARARPNEFRVDEWFEPTSGAQRFRSPHERREVILISALIGALAVLVLVVASANLGNLVLSHSIGRLREFSIRTALGAGWRRLLRHLLIEAGLLAAAGGSGGMLLGYWAARVFAASTGAPPYLDWSPDVRLFAAGTAGAFVAFLAFGLAPAWIVSRRDLTGAMRDGGAQTSAGLSRARFRKFLVGAQVAGCCVLLVVAAGITRGLQRLLSTDLGFEYERIVVLDAGLDRAQLRDAAARAYWARVSEGVAAHPEVEGTALAWPSPLGDTISVSMYGDGLQISNVQIQPAFFALFDIAILSGRNFGPADTYESSVIISRRLALAMYGTLDVIGRGFPRSSPGRTIIGVAGDAPLVSARPTGVAEQYTLLDPAGYDDVALIARARGNPERLLTPLRTAARDAHPRATPRVGLLRNAYEEKLQGPRLASLVATLTGLLVLALASLGIFGVVAFAVAVRTKEIGIRRALGASSRSIVRLVVGQLAWPVIAGAGAGTGVGLIATLALARSPFNLAVADAAAPAAALAVFAFTALAALLWPASRALRNDPLEALRHE